MGHSPEVPDNASPDLRTEEPRYVPDWRNPFSPREGFTTQIMPDHSVRFVPVQPAQTKPAPETPHDNTR